MEKKNFSFESNQITNCVYCRTKVKLNEEEMESKTFFCPKCNRENVVWHLREDYLETIVQDNDNNLIYYIGAASALILIILIPYLSGIL